MSDLPAAIAYLESTLDDLCRFLREHAIARHTVMFSIPRVRSEQHAWLKQYGFSQMNADTLTGKAALRKCLAGYQTLTEPDGELSRIYLPRFPGFIVVPDIDAAVQRVNTVNEAKRDLKRQALQIDDPDDRHAALHKACQFLITNAAYREIECIDYPVKSLYFNFVPGASSQNFTLETLIGKLEQWKNCPQQGFDYKNWGTYLDSVIDHATSHYPHHLFRTRRVSQAAPECTIRDTDNRLRQNFMASLPVIIPTLPDTYTQLGHVSFDGDQKRSSRKTQYAWVPLVKRLRLYVTEQPVACDTPVLV